MPQHPASPKIASATSSVFLKLRLPTPPLQLLRQPLTVIMCQSHVGLKAMAMAVSHREPDFAPASADTQAQQRGGMPRSSSRKS